MHMQMQMHMHTHMHTHTHTHTHSIYYIEDSENWYRYMHPHLNTRPAIGSRGEGPHVQGIVYVLQIMSKNRNILTR
jgi:hypothetical protein